MTVPNEISSQFGKMSSGVAELKYSEEGFEVKVEVKAFELNELRVQIDNKSLLVCGDHRIEFQGKRCFHQRFKSCYALPDDLGGVDVTATLNGQGQLTIKGKKINDGKTQPAVRDVPITTE